MSDFLTTVAGEVGSLTFRRTASESRAANFVPEAVKRIRAAWVIVAYALGGNTACCYYDESWRRFAESTNLAIVHARFSTISGNPPTLWRNAELGGGEALLSVLNNLSRETGHSELRQISLLFWGHSQGGPFGSTFAALHPRRTIASVRYQSGPFGLDLPAMTRVPTLFFFGDRDTVAAPSRPEATRLWNVGRGSGAPWTFANEPNAEHGSLPDVEKANALLFPWLAAVLNQRLASNGTVRDMTDRNGWLGNLGDHSIASYAAASFPKNEASWLPDEASAKGWLAVTSASNR